MKPTNDNNIGCGFVCRNQDILDQWYYRGTLDFLVYRAGNEDTLVTNDISISQLGIEIFRSEK